MGDLRRRLQSISISAPALKGRWAILELASVALATACRKCVWGVSASIGLSSGHGLARTAIELAHRASESLRLGLNELALALHS